VRIVGKALVLIDNGFQEAELLYPYYRLQEAGYTVDLVGPKAGQNYVGDHGYGMNADLSRSCYK